MKTERRDFIKKTLMGGAIASLAPLSGFAFNESENDESEFNEEKKKNPRSGVLTLLQTTDVHCQLDPHDELFWENGKSVFRKTAGYARLANAFKSIRKKSPHTFIIDTGDMFQGSALSVKTTGEAISPILNALQYDLYLPGNWEVIYGKRQMQRLLGGLDAPKICANMYHDLGEGKKGELIFPAYGTWTAMGVKIGFIGYTDPLVPIRQSPNYSKGIVYTKPEENLAYYVDLLRNQEQCQFIIVLAHLGLSQQIHLANLPECEGVNYIFGGDTHERVRRPIQCKYAKVVEPGAFGSFIGRLDLEVKDGKIVAEKYELIEVNDRFKEDKEVAELVKKVESPFSESIDKVIGYSEQPLYRYFVVENTIDTLITDALKWKVGTDIVLSNGFRFCPPRATPDATGKIPITEAYLFDMLPVDSTIRRARASGKQIKEWLEKELNNVFAQDASKRVGGWVVKFTGMKMTFNAFGEMGSRVQTLTVNDQPIDENREYTICACEREGDPEDMLCRIKNVKEARNTQYTLHSVVKDYLKSSPSINTTPHGNAIVLDAPQTLLTQVYGVDYQFV